MARRDAWSRRRAPRRVGPAGHPKARPFAPPTSFQYASRPLPPRACDEMRTHRDVASLSLTRTGVAFRFQHVIAGSSTWNRARAEERIAQLEGRNAPDGRSRSSATGERDGLVLLADHTSRGRAVRARRPSSCRCAPRARRTVPSRGSGDHHAESGSDSGASEPRATATVSMRCAISVAGARRTERLAYEQRCRRREWSCPSGGPRPRRDEAPASATTRVPSRPSCSS